MKNVAGNESAAADQSQKILQKLRDEFDAAWQHGLESGERPLLASYLARAPAAARVALRKLLEEIERDYEERWSALRSNPPTKTFEFGDTKVDADKSGPATLDIVVAEPNPSNAPAPATLEFVVAEPNPSHAPAPATLEFVVAEPNPSHTPGATLEFVDAETDFSLSSTPEGVSVDRGDKTDPNLTLDSVPPAAALSDPNATDPDITIDTGPCLYAETMDPDEPTGSSAPGEPSPDTVHVAGHELLGELGRGGMGVVYKARQVKLNRLVALKMVLAGAHAAPHQLARFQIEAEAVARLKHPNIVQIYEVGEHDGLPFFSLEYVDGGCLASKIGGKPQPPREAAAMVERLADAMASAHHVDIIHRDLKPANILLTAEGSPKITDFGLAKRLEEDSSQTRAGTIMGTPNYMAPEQARGDSKTIGPLSDLYALGAILYEMLTGRPPFQGTTVLETLELVQKQEPVPPSRLQPKVPRDLETICLKCLQKEPEKRYPNTGVLATDLMRFLGGETIVARPVGQIEKGWRWCRRNPRVAVLTAAVIALVLTAGSSFAVLAAKDARDRQEAAERLEREQQALDEARARAEQRIEQATEAIRTGHLARAADLVRGADETLQADELADVRDRVRTLQAQIALFGEFQRVLDRARYSGLIGGSVTPEQARANCRQVIQLYDDIEQRAGAGAVGLPPLSPQQQELFREDAFETFLIAAWVENNAGPLAHAAAEQAARQAVQWLNRAEKLVPPTRVLFVHRSIYEGKLKDVAAGEADLKRALTIPPTSTIDHFWHGFADRMRARDARAEGDLKGMQEHLHKAIGEYAALLRQRPEHFWAYFEWANCQFQLRNFDDAVVGYTACIHLKPDAPWPYNNRGSSHMQLGQHEQAIQDYTLALERDDRAIDTYINRAQAYLAQGSREPALADFTRAIELGPERAASYFQRAEAHRQLKQFAEAIQDCDRALQKNANSAEAHTGRGLILLAQKHPEQALPCFDRALQANPKYYLALVQRAKTRRQLKQLDKARDDYNRALAIQPTDVPLLMERAELHQELEMPDAAASDYSRVIALRPADSKVYIARAGIYLALGQYAKARDDCSAAIRLAPKDPTAVRFRGIVNLALLHDLDAAFDDWFQLTVLQPKSAEAFFRVAAIEIGRKHYATALEDLKKAQALDPNYIEIRWARAQVHLWQGNLDQALAAVNVTVEKLPPAKPEGLNIRGDIYRAMGRLDQAAADYRRLIQLKPGDPNAYISLAGIYERQGKPDEAVRTCDEMVKRADRAASAKAYLRRAEFRRNRELYTDALADCDEAAKRDPKLAAVALVRAGIEAQRGHPYEAVADAERILASTADRDGYFLYSAACVFSLAAAATAADPENADAVRRSRQYADRAIALLAETLGRGFHDLLYPEHNRMLDDPAFASLRDEPRARDLLAHRP